ncbi:AI-2E family transporter [Trichocoleus sp. FACHB-262]|uniref:AI-2E family transporter n=1 Tax=Trichocoleus sp. FACHB-262 TaxID=2692869 RepID=UPI0016855DDB|nr:AI-2E family transporter [Trichocoleus sp. FACHB-262]MBD2124091.1 AI-2E family transporter [Trichocoleus sp. FACHB-262]
MTNSPNKVQRWLAWGLPFPLIVLNAWVALQVFEYFEPLVTVVGLGVLLAFVLNYPVRFLHQRGMKRNRAVFLTFSVALLVVIGVGVTLIPIVLEQLSEVIRVLPSWINSGSTKLERLNQWLETRNLPIDFSHLATQLTDRFPDEVQALAEELLTLALDTVNSVSDVLLTAVLTFYLLLDGDRLWNGLFRRLPSRFGVPIQRSLQQNFQNYFLGQVTLAALVGTAMTLAFLALRLKFGLLFGLGIGVMTLIPFGDVLSFVLVGLLVASHDFWLGARTLGVAVVVDQVIDQAIAPRLIGSFTGLSPIWVIAVLVIGTKVGGLLGLLIAVPIASSIKSLLDISFQPVPEDNGRELEPSNFNPMQLTPAESDPRS